MAEMFDETQRILLKFFTSEFNLHAHVDKSSAILDTYLKYN